MENEQGFRSGKIDALFKEYRAKTPNELRQLKDDFATMPELCSELESGRCSGTTFSGVTLEHVIFQTVIEEKERV
jgi:hypothetical protein